jgi:hypothetical protein
VQELLPFVLQTNTEIKAVLDEEKDLQVNYIFTWRLRVYLISAFYCKHSFR